MHYHHEHSSIARIEYCEFSEHWTNVLYIQSSIDIDRTILIKGSTFSSNYIQENGNIVYFESFSNGLYFNDTETEYCHTRLCGAKLAIYDSHFIKNNNIKNNGVILKIDIQHVFNLSSQFRGVFDDEIAIEASQFIDNEADVISIQYQYHTQNDHTIDVLLSEWNILDITDTLFDRNYRGLVFKYHTTSYDSTAKLIKINKSQFLNSYGTVMDFDNMYYIFLSIKNSNISNNIATSSPEYGAVYIDCNDGSIVDISHCNFVNNTGGAISIHVVSSNYQQPPTMIPTTEPTFEPTIEPTIEPTNIIPTTFTPTTTPSSSTLDPTPISPSMTPINALATTVSPSTTPANALTMNPTKTQTSNPTLIPTVSPSISAPAFSEPTQIPTTISFSVIPTNAPTIKPTFIPTTGSPSMNPSNAPTTGAPSMSPTNAPTSNPTHSPSMSPTNAPSTQPTHIPTDAPTNAPTTEPTDSPSMSPSNAPTSAPTREPTGAPSMSPTKAPTSDPTTAPSISPTNAPTMEPTPIPTTGSPSMSPTNAPTSNPTHKPTPIPTLPTVSVSLNPTHTPTTGLPSMSPTNEPTSDPTQEPTNEPTNEPTMQPTMEPIKSPTMSPSPYPTKNPTTPAPTFTEEMPQCHKIYISNSIVSGNTATGFGGGLSLQYEAKTQCMEVSIDGTTFKDNQANHGGALFINRINSGVNDVFNLSISVNDVYIMNNKANGTGGGVYFADDLSIVATISRSYITGNTVNYYGAGVYLNCVQMYIKDTLISSNTITFSRDSTSETSCRDDNCLEKHAKYVNDTFGGSGAGIYSLSSSITLDNNEFINNVINIGNGAAFTSKLNLKYKLDLKLIVVNNTVSNNDIYSSLPVMDNDVNCAKYGGLMGFSAGFWIDISSVYKNESVLLRGNTFKSNRGAFINDLYYNIFDVESLDTMKWLKSTHYSNIFSESFESKNTMNARAYGSSAINVSDIMISPKVSGSTISGDIECDEDKGCLGYILPGDQVFQPSFKLINIYGDYTTPLLACSHLVYNISSDLRLQQIYIRLDNDDVRLQVEATRAQYNAIDYVNMSDTHQVINNITTYVIATLCQSGQAVSLSNVMDKDISVCSTKDVSGIEFKCGSYCPESYYLFTRWEPTCHHCEASGVTCSGGNNVILHYAYWAKVYNNTVTIDIERNISICNITFKTYLCPTELCCDDADGCVFNGLVSDKTTFCAANRNPEYPFCGKCLPHYYQVIGTYACSKCEEDESWVLILPVIGSAFLLIYLLLRDPYTVTPLFTYIYKSLLYFYQILPILTYRSNIGLLSKVSDFFNLSIVYHLLNDSNGTCLFGGMSAMGKLFSNFIVPLILLTELLILRQIPEIIKWCWSFDDTYHYRVVFDKDNESSIGLLSQSQSELDSSKQSISAMMKKERAKQRALNWAQKIRENFSQAGWNAFLIAYISLCSSCIHLFNCAEVDGKYYLWHNGAIECWMGKNTVVQIIFLLIFIILCIFPFYVIYTLRKFIKNMDAKNMKKEYAVFVTSYSTKCWYYESVMMLRRILLLVVYALPKSEQLLLRGILSLLCTAILGVHLKVAPFINPVNNWLETSLLSILCAVSTLTAVNTQSRNKRIDTVLTVLSTLPILPLPWLMFRYCRRRIVPKLRQSIAFSTELVYIPPQTQKLIDDDQDDEDDKFL